MCATTRVSCSCRTPDPDGRAATGRRAGIRERLLEPDLRRRPGERARRATGARARESAAKPIYAPKRRPPCKNISSSASAPTRPVRCSRCYSQPATASRRSRKRATAPAKPAREFLLQLRRRSTHRSDAGIQAQQLAVRAFEHQPHCCPSRRGCRESARTSCSSDRSRVRRKPQDERVLRVSIRWRGSCHSSVAPFAADRASAPSASARSRGWCRRACRACLESRSTRPGTSDSETFT